MRLDSLHDLYVTELKDIYNAEKLLLKALPKMAKAASSADLRAAFEEHLEVTRGQVERLEEVFEGMDMAPRGKKCRAMEGLIEEGKEMMEEEAEPAVMDAALICAAQKVEHYEIAAYGCLRTYARELGYDDAAELLQKTLDEEGEADKKLTQLAEGSINTEAEEGEEAEQRAESQDEKEGDGRDRRNDRPGRGIGGLVTSAARVVKKAVGGGFGKKRRGRRVAVYQAK
jgi:ferritin-like metal-binding protein YciE